MELADAQVQQEFEGRRSGDDDDDDVDGDDGDEYNQDPSIRSGDPWRFVVHCVAGGRAGADADGEGDYSPMTYSESAEIMTKKYLERDQRKLALEQEERERRLQRVRNRRLQIEKWQHKTTKSPFKVNLVADNERLDEEHRVRVMEEARRARELEKRTKQAKNDVILKALSDASDLDLLRREKRAIIDEERRLKALMDLEKTNSHRKLDLIAARNAEKKRRQEKEEFRRKQRQQELEMREQRYRQLLKEKLAIEDR
ncbi:TPA: hypothetical protein N0F65_007033 [Lagenidium giganteum]|uniref:Uncharacterized protein n=1 Tax=Lagenidium giganteum TaxID=4803 RepID=A0AAV2Z1D2_9STRA|nr:TPA: hypothetical protein N0F65_007033 [Lagenidium giganteum]